MILSYQQYITANGKYPDRLGSKDLTQDVTNNAIKLVTRLNEYLSELGILRVVVSSGFRPNAVNAKIANAAKKSNHLMGLAVDFQDDGTLARTILSNLELARKYGLYIEDPRWTKGWVHLQLVAPSSRKRIFVPSSQPGTNVAYWNDVDFDKLDLS